MLYKFFWYELSFFIFGFSDFTYSLQLSEIEILQNQSQIASMVFKSQIKLTDCIPPVYYHPYTFHQFTARRFTDKDKWSVAYVTLDIRLTILSLDHSGKNISVTESLFSYGSKCILPYMTFTESKTVSEISINQTKVQTVSSLMFRCVGVCEQDDSYCCLGSHIAMPSWMHTEHNAL